MFRWYTKSTVTQVCILAIVLFLAPSHLIETLKANEVIVCWDTTSTVLLGNYGYCISISYPNSQPHTMLVTWFLTPGANREHCTVQHAVARPLQVISHERNSTWKNYVKEMEDNHILDDVTDIARPKSIFTPAKVAMNIDLLSDARLALRFDNEPRHTLGHANASTHMHNCTSYLWIMALQWQQFSPACSIYTEHEAVSWFLWSINRPRIVKGIRTWSHMNT